MLIEAPWLPTVLNMLAEVTWYCPIIKDLIMDVTVGSVLKGLPYLHLTLFDALDMCVAQTGFLFLTVSASSRGNLSMNIEGLPAVLEGMGSLVCLRGCTKTMSYLPLN